MSNYNPDRWAIIEIITTTEKIYKVFGGWYGGWTDGDSWRMNSGITKIVKDGEYFHFHGHTGSVYTCRDGSYGMSVLMSAVYLDMLNKIPEHVSFRNLTEAEAFDYINGELKNESNL